MEISAGLEGTQSAVASVLSGVHRRPITFPSVQFLPTRSSSADVRYVFTHGSLSDSQALVSGRTALLSPPVASLSAAKARIVGAGLDSPGSTPSCVRVYPLLRRVRSRSSFARSKE